MRRWKQHAKEFIYWTGKNTSHAVRINYEPAPCLFKLGDWVMLHLSGVLFEPMMVVDLDGDQVTCAWNSGKHEDVFSTKNLVKIPKGD